MRPLIFLFIFAPMKKISVKIARIILIGIGILIALAITSCGPQKRCERFIKKHPGCVKVDTLTFRDTFIKKIRVPVPEYKDSFIIQCDTFIETKKLIVTKYKDKFTIKVKPDTITFRDTTRIEVKVPGRIVEKKIWNWPLLLLAFTLGVLATVFMTRK